MIRIFTFSLFFLLSNSFYSQNYIGLFGGINSSKLIGDAPNSAKYKSLIGANFGANIDIKLAKSIYLSLQPSYSQEGTKISYSFKGIDEAVDSLKIRLNYFSLPLLLKITSSNERFYAIAGIETGFLQKSYVKSHDLKEDIQEDIIKWNLAMHFGVGLRIPIGFPILFTELRYSQGLDNLTDEPIVDNNIPRVKTNGFKILFGIEFPLKKSTK